MATDMRIGLTIEAQANGAEKIAKLESDLKELGHSADAASPEFAALTKEVQDLSRQAQAIQGFTQLKQASEETAAKLAEMQQVTRQSALAIKEKQQASIAAASAEQAAAAQLAQARQQQEQMRASVKTLKQELDALGKAARAGGDNAQEMALQLSLGKAQLQTLEVQAKASAQQVQALGAAHKSSSAALGTANAEVNKAQQQFDRLRQSTRAVGQSLQEQQQDVQRARDGLVQVGLSAKNLAQGQAQVNKSTLATQAALKALQTAAKEAAVAQTGTGNAAEQMGRRAKAGAQQAAQGAGLVQQSTHKVRDGVQSISTQLDTARQQLLGFLGIQMGAGAVKDVIGLADAYKNLQSRIGLVAGEGEHLARTMDDVQAVALRTHSALEGTGVLFTRIAQAGKDAGLSLEQATEQSLALTESINQAVAISGAGAAASDAAITQLIQGLQSGVLRGEEFNSVMEQAPRLARALADGLGVTTGELRKLAESGALTTDVVIKSLQSQGQALEQEFGKLPLTVGRAITDVQTAFMRYVADVDEANGVTTKLAGAVGFVGEHLEALADTLVVAGKGWMAFKAYNMAQTWLDKAKAIVAAKLAVQEETLATQANTQGKAANTAAAKAQATAATASTTATDANTAATVANTAAIAASTAAQAANTTERAGITGFLGASTKATQASTAAITANTTAKAASTRVSGLLGGAISATAGAARGLMGVLGGPLGLAITVATFGSEIKRGIGAVVEWGAGFTAAGRQMKASTAALAQMERQEKINAELRRQQAREDAARAAAAELAIARQFDLSKAAQAATAEFVKLTKEGKTAAQAVADIAKGFDTTSQQGLRDFGAVLNKLAADGKLTAEQLQAAWGQILKTEDLQLFQLQARQAFAGTAQEAQIMAQITEAALAQALQRTGMSLGVLTGGMGEAARSAINDVQTIADSLDTLAQQGVDTGVALAASLGKAIDTADSQKAIEAVRSQVKQLRGALGDKIADGLLQQAEQKARDLRKALDDATPGIQGVEEAMRKLGITSDTALKDAALTARQAFDTLRQSGTASTRELREAFRVAAQAAIDAAGGIAPSWVMAEAGVRGFIIEVDESGKHVLRLTKDIRDANNETGNLKTAWYGVGQAIESAADKAARVKKETAAAAEAAEAADRERRRQDGYGIDTKRQTYEQAKSSGLSEAQALAVADEFWNNGKKSGWGGARLGDTWGSLVAKRIDEMVLANARQKATEEKSKDTQPAAASSRPGGATYISNITLPGGSTRQLRFTDAASQSTAEQLLRELARAKGAAA